MNSEKPLKLAIDHDDYHAEHVGKTSSGLQFFLTTPFVPKTGISEGCEYIALYKFDSDGNLLEALIDTLGPRGSYDESDRKQRYLSRLSELGTVEYCRIEIKPFSIERAGIVFGLVPREPEDEDDIWAVELLPGNYMAFFEPWDSGQYDT